MLNLSVKWITFSTSVELAVEDAFLLDLEDGTIVKHSVCPKLSWKMLQLSLQNGNSDKSLDLAYSTLLSYGLGMGARTTCLKTLRCILCGSIWDPYAPSGAGEL